MKKIVGYIFFGVITLLPACGGGDDPKACPKADCGNYATQEQAQKAYDADPVCMDELDNDNDKIACEDLPRGGGTGCPTTANCGCSGKNKTPCESSACCQWITNDGCRCK